MYVPVNDRLLYFLVSNVHSQYITYYCFAYVKAVLCLLEIVCFGVVVDIVCNLVHSWQRVQDAQVLACTS